MSHGNAFLTERGRLALARCVVDDRWPLRRAAERFGFTYEGHFRRAVINQGRSRDTTWFAMIDEEWPALKEAYARKQEEVWDWRWQDGPTRRIFRVSFDFDGRVLSAAALDDPRDLYR